MLLSKKGLAFIFLVFFLSFAFFYMKSSIILDYDKEKLQFKENAQHQNTFESLSRLWAKLNFFGNGSFNVVTKNLLPCPNIPPSLGPVNVVTDIDVSLSEIILKNPNVQNGGHSKPHHCKALQKIAIIIPFRNREPHLKIWLYYMHPFLQRQQGDYGIYVVEQSNMTTFNRAKLMNVGFKEAVKDYDYGCFIFHDVDIIPMDERHLYRCLETHPRHMANSLDKFNFRLPYETIFGGIVAFTLEQFHKVNGFSNMFWGWGGEDDELYNRVVGAGMTIERPLPNISRSKAIFHDRDKGNERTGKSFYLIDKAAGRMHIDGLSTLNYSILSHFEHKLYKKITVEIGSPEKDSL